MRLDAASMCMHVRAVSGRAGDGQRRELGSGGITFYMNGQSLDALAFRVVRAACFGNIKFQSPCAGRHTPWLSEISHVHAASQCLEEALIMLLLCLWWTDLRATRKCGVK